MHYRLYFLDTKGHVREGQDLDCESDAEALQRMRDLPRGDRAIELWQATRKLDFLPPAEGSEAG